MMDHGGYSNIISLRDGRSLGYAVYGDPRGHPVMFFHGTPASRLAGESLDEAARARGVCLIAPDRPGYGLSTFKPGRGILDWTKDVIELADTLGLDGFPVWGSSGGGPYALACAYKIPHRIEHVILESGLGPFDLPGAGRNMKALNRAGSTFASRAPFQIVRLVGEVIGRGVKALPGPFYLLMAASSSARDRERLRRPEVRERALRMSAEPFRSGGAGWAWEERILALPWEFRLEEVGGRVDIYHGEEDADVPIMMAYQMRDRLPRCRLTSYPGVGHQFDEDIIGGIFDELLRGRSGHSERL